jgi:acetylornithine deacetylase/succinyl-diaminopimelate desuccinylase-like protein
MLVKLLLFPTTSNTALRMLGKAGNLFEPLFHNTVNATVVRGGGKVNVIPSEIILELDGRLLPGLTPALMLRELKSMLGTDFDIEIVRHEPGPPQPDMSRFPILVQIMKEADPDGYPIPFVMIGVTDARIFSRLGIQTYGFTPMRLPPNFNFASLAHGANERIPVDALAFGTQAIYKVMERL